MTYAIQHSSGSSNGGSAASGGAPVYATPVFFEDGTPANPALAFSNDMHKGVYADNTGVGIATNGTKRVFVDNTGNVALLQNLSVAGSAAITGPITLAAGAGIYNITQPSPNGVVTAIPASICVSSTGGPNATLWVKEAGFDSQGWVNITRPTLNASCASGTAVGACIYLSGNSGSYTATTVNITSLNTAPAVGVVQSVSGTSCVVCLSGLAASVGTSFTPNAALYVGQNGALTTDTSSLTTPYYLQSMGRAISQTDAIINVGDVSLYRS